MAPRKPKKTAQSLPGEEDVTPEAIGRTLADYAAKVVKTLSKLGFDPLEARAPGTQEWAKLYYESDGQTTHRVTLIIPTDTAGLSPVKIENIVITTQRVLPPDVERWIAASGSAAPTIVGPGSVAFTQTGSGLVTSRPSPTLPGLAAPANAPGAPPVHAAAVGALPAQLRPPAPLDSFAGPFSRDVAFLLRALDIETRGSVVDLYTCSTCKNPTDSWVVGKKGEILCPTCT